MRSLTKLVKDVACQWRSSGQLKGSPIGTGARQADFVLEALEPRVLLSATVTEVPAAAAVASTGSVVVCESVPNQSSTTGIAWQDHSGSIIPEQKELVSATENTEGAGLAEWRFDFAGTFESVAHTG